jgi:hypothetical protein
VRDSEGPSRSRGVRLSDLDKSRVYRIHHTGRRWEVLGAEGEPDSPDVLGRWVGAGAEGASTTTAPAVGHRMPDV